MDSKYYGFLNQEDADRFTIFDNKNNYVKAKTPIQRMEDIKSCWILI
ncbi:MAG: hypothetical protein ACREV6_00290 [Clostridium sp.]